MNTHFVLFVILLLSVSNLLFVSCNNDDDDIQPIKLYYNIYNDKPNPVINNQIAINLPIKTKIELIIFGGDGKYAIRNSDDTKLSVSYNNGSLKLTTLASGNITITIVDGSNNVYILNVQITNLSE